MDHTFREEDRVVIAEFHGVGPFRGTVIQANEEQVEVLVDEDEGNKHFCTVYSENFRLLSHEGTEEPQTIEQAFEAWFRPGEQQGRDQGYVDGYRDGKAIDKSATP
ncbi:MAG: hypothetical protein P8J00_14535 [Yoonia sp.]|nr:hypothetical protein [Yoonia sp.]